MSSEQARDSDSFSIVDCSGLNSQAVRLLSRAARVPLPATEKSLNNNQIVSTRALDERIKRARLLITRKARQARDQTSVLYRTVSEPQTPLSATADANYEQLKKSTEQAEDAARIKQVPKRARQGTTPRENYSATTKEETRISHTTGVAMLDVLYRQPGGITTESAMLTLLDQTNVQTIIESYLGSNRHVVKQYIEQFATHPFAYEKWSALATEYDDADEAVASLKVKPSLTIETDILSRCPTIELLKLQQQQQVQMQTDDSFEQFAYDIAVNFAELIRVSKFLYFEKSRTENSLVLWQKNVMDKNHKKYYEIEDAGDESDRKSGDGRSANDENFVGDELQLDDTGTNKSCCCNAYPE